MGRGELNPKQVVNKKFQLERKFQNHENTIDSRIRIPSIRSLKKPSQMMKDAYCDNVIDLGKDNLACNDSNYSIVSKEITKPEICLEDDISVSTAASTLSSISALSVTSAFYNAQGNRRRFFSRFRDVMDNVKDGLALELEAEKGKATQSRCDEN